MMEPCHSFGLILAHLLSCMPDMTSAWCEPIAHLGVPVVPPENRKMEGSLGFTSTAGLGADSYFFKSSPSHTSPACGVMRYPSFFSLTRVNKKRSTGGRYSLMFVAITVSTFVW